MSIFKRAKHAAPSEDVGLQYEPEEVAFPEAFDAQAHANAAYAENVLPERWVEGPGPRVAVVGDGEYPEGNYNLVESPDHYQFPGGVQVIDITRHLGFLEGNIVKYASRAGRKGDKKEDLLKAKKYLDWAIEEAS